MIDSPDEYSFCHYYELSPSLEARVSSLIRAALLEVPVDDQWLIVIDTLNLHVRQRAVSKAYVSLCVVHDEKTPSFYMYPSGYCICYGCQFEGDAADLIVSQRYAAVDEFIKTAGLDIASELPTLLGDLQRQRQQERLYFRQSLPVDQEPF